MLVKPLEFQILLPMSQLQLYLDETSPTIQLTPSSAWADNSSELWTNGHSQIVNQFPGAKLQFTFNGTTAIFHGASLNDTTFAPVVDDLPQPRVSLPSSNPPAYGEWYRTPTLQPGEHVVVINDLPKVTLDYIVVVVDPSTTFQNTPILVSDSDQGLKYTGSWEKDFSRFKSLQPFTFIGDYSTRSSCNPGDTLTLDFSGSSIQLWGVFDWQSVGSVTAAYFIDGHQVAQQIYQADQTSQNAIFGVQTNFLLFSKNDLSSGSHNILVNITACTNQRFSIDYITYTPSFTSGNSAPTISATSGTASGSPEPHFPVGAIAGIVVGAAVLMALAGLLLWCCKRRRSGAAEPFPTSSSSFATTRKEEVPPHMRQLRSPTSQDTIDLTEGSGANGHWVISHNPSEMRNIDELVLGAPPPAYPNRGAGTAATDSTFETTATNVHRSPS